MCAPVFILQMFLLRISKYMLHALHTHRRLMTYSIFVLAQQYLSIEMLEYSSVFVIWCVQMGLNTFELKTRHHQYLHLSLSFSITRELSPQVCFIITCYCGAFSLVFCLFCLSIAVMPMYCCTLRLWQFFFVFILFISIFYYFGYVFLLFVCMRACLLLLLLLLLL